MPDHSDPPPRGRHVVVTGAGRGIGRAIALRLAADGATLSLLSRGVVDLRATGRGADALGAPEPFVTPCDIRDRASVERAFSEAVAANGPVHALVANSGIGGPNADGPGDRFGDLVETNLVGTYNCARAAQARFAPGPEPRQIVVIASILARIGVPGYTGYCASKAGLLGLVRSLAAELAGDGIAVNAICPGWIDTNMAWEGIDGIAEAMGWTREQAFEHAMREVPTGRMGQPEEIAGTVAWLLRDDARNVTGQTIDHNGGAYMA